MIYTHQHFLKNRSQPKSYRTSVCIVGSGAGASAAAYQLTQSGVSVILVESGSFLTPSDFQQLEDDSFKKLFYDGGGRRTADKAIRVLHGKGVGGSTLHNINLCKEIPETVFNSWQLSQFTHAQFKPYLDTVRDLLKIQPILPAQVNENNRLFQLGTERLGFRGGLLSHNREGCVQSGFCELGCAFDAKNNALKMLLPKAIENGLTILADTKAINLKYTATPQGAKAETLTAVVLNPSLPARSPPIAEISITAEIFICAGGAIETPLLLKRSKTPDPEQLIGSRLHLHPGVVVAGLFEQKVNSWKGIPQSWECTEFLDFSESTSAHKTPTAQQFDRTWLIAGSAHPAGTASLMPAFGTQSRELMQNYSHLSAISAMVHDTSQGSITAGIFGEPKIHYTLNESDLAELTHGLYQASRILFAAGAKEVIYPTGALTHISSVDELDRLYQTTTQNQLLDVTPGDIDIVSVHPMSSVWMGNSPKDSCANQSGRIHTTTNVYVSDTSLYPTSIGVPPQWSTYAIGLYVADQIVHQNIFPIKDRR